MSFQLQLRIENKTAWDSLDTNSHHHLFRITQELIANAKKHSEASIVKFHFYKTDRQFVLEYEDDGIGFDQQTRSEGAGLLGISHRVSSLVGELRMDTSIDEGVRLRIAWPYEGGLANEAAG
ncbi:Sensor histidine kinase ComP [compost metagenome]